MPDTSAQDPPIPTTAEQTRSIFPGFYDNRAIKALSESARWTVSGALGDLDEAGDVKQRKAPIDMRHLLETGRLRGAWARDERCLLSLDELTTRLPQAANAAYYLQMQTDGLIMVDIEPDCPEEIASALLQMPRIIYSETSMSGRGYHLLMRAPSNLDEFPHAAAKTVLREEHGWYELLMEHWVTFTRRPIPTSRIMAAHVHQPDPKTPSTLEELFAQLGENVTASIEVDPLSTGDQMPEIPLTEQIVTGVVVAAHGHLRSIEDFNHDTSRWEFSVLGSLYGWLRTQLAIAEGTSSHHYDDSDRAWLLYAAAVRMLPARDKHAQLRNGRPYLLDQAASMVAKARASEAALLDERLH